MEGLLSEQQIELGAVLCFELPLEEIVSTIERASHLQRAAARCTMSRSSRRPCPTSAIIAAAALFCRDDDEPEAIRVRMRVYEEETAPLIDFYTRKGKLVRIPAVGTPEEIRDRAGAVTAGASGIATRD